MVRSQTPEIAVIILNYNGRKWLEQFLPSVVQNTPTSLAKIWIADNASTDDSVAWVKSLFPSVNTLTLAQNFGFAEGYNQAIGHIPCRFVLLLNSDVEVTPNWLEPLYQLLRKDTAIAACQPKILSYNEKEKFEYAGAAGGLIDIYGYPFCRGRILNSIEKDGGQYEGESEIFWASGACMLIRKDLFLTAGGFDQDFFAHMEEIDLCWRLKNLGYQIQYTSSSIVYHVGGGTLQTGNPQKTFLNFRNNRLLLFKNLRKGTIVRTNIIRNILDMLAMFNFLLHFQFKDAWAVIRAQIAFRKMMFQAFNKRQQFEYIREKNSIREANTKGLYPKSILIQFYLNKKKKFTQLRW